MKPKLLPLSVLAIAPVCLSAAAGAASPVSASLSLYSPQTVEQGEPIILYYQIMNNDPLNKVGVHLGDFGKGWYTVHMTNNVGDTAVPVSDTRPNPRGGLNGEQASMLNPAGDTGAALNGYIVVSQSLAVTHPGKYTLTVDLDLPCDTKQRIMPDPAKPLPTFDPDNPAADADAMFTQSDTFAVTVTPPVPEDIQKVATQLQQQISAHPYGPLGKALATALFSMPEADAAGCWHALADKPSVASEVYAKELERLATPTAADILAEMLSHPGLTTETASYIGQCLDEMYNVGNAPLRQHIAEIAIAHGLLLPEKVPIPQLSD